MENKKNNTNFILSESKITYSPDSLVCSGTSLDVETIKNWQGPYGSGKEIKMNKHKKDCSCYTCKPDFVREFDITEIKKEKNNEGKQFKEWLNERHTMKDKQFKEWLTEKKEK